MTEFPIASSAAKAWAGSAQKARTQADAAAKAGAPVTLTMEALPETFESANAAYAAAPELYERGGEVVLIDGAWRVMTRFWRPLPSLPVADSARAALRAPVGTARTSQEAAQLAGGPVTERLHRAPWKYASRKTAMAKWSAMIEAGIAELAPVGDRFVVLVRFWQPDAAASGPRDLAARLAAPLRAQLPQSPLDIGLFEVRAPENPDVVLAEEGDGRRHQT